MLKLMPLLLVATVAVSGTGAFAIPSTTVGAPSVAFAVFFDPAAASLSKEGREIVLVAAKQFALSHGRDSAARIVLGTESDAHVSAALSNARVNSVNRELLRDGIQKRFIGSEQQTNAHADAVRLEEDLDQRVSISIRENFVVGRL